MKSLSPSEMVPSSPQAYWVKRISVIAITAAVLALPGYAVAQTYPEKTIRLVVPNSPGGSLDRYSRMIAQKLTEALGQTVLVDNRPSAGGIIGADIVAKSAPDGYTLLMGATPTMAINVTLYAGKLPYNPEKDFAPITLTAKLPSMLAVNPAVPAKNLKEFIALAKAKPGKLNYGSSGIGSGNHLVGEMLKAEAGIDIVHVPYGGGAPGLVALLSGQIEVLITPPPTLMPMVKAGRVRAIAISSAKRLPAMPEIPTIAESGLPGFEATLWFCIVAPAGVPKPIITRLHTALVPILNSPEYRERLTAEGATGETSTPEELTAFVRAEIPKWAKVVKSSGAKVE